MATENIDKGDLQLMPDVNEFIIIAITTPSSKVIIRFTVARYVMCLKSLVNDRGK